MAAYDYRCRSCGTGFEVRRGVHDVAAPVRCPSGHGDVARVWSAVAVLGAASGRTPGASPGAAPAAPASSGCCGGGCCG